MLKKIVALLAINTCIVLGYFLFTGNLTALFTIDILPRAPIKEIVITQAAPFATLSPVAFAAPDQAALSLVYEPLIRFDSYLTPQSALAIAYSFTSDTELSVRLRKNAIFHTGAPVTCADVAASFALAKQYGSPEAVGIRVDAKTDVECVLSTEKPDFNLLKKLTRIFILPSGTTETDFFAAPGTGRYTLTNRTEKELSFAAFEGYYDASPELPQTITLTVETNKYMRLASLQQKTSHIALDIPAQSVPQVEERFGYVVTQVPSYDALFLLANTRTSSLQDEALLRRVFARLSAIEYTTLLPDASLKRASQFVPGGVFGFSPELAMQQKVAVSSEAIPIDTVFTLATTAANRPLADAIQHAAEKEGLTIKPQTLPEDVMGMRIAEASYDFYLVGYRFSLGFADDFLQSLVATDAFGQLFSDANMLQEKVRQALAEQDAKKRLAALQSCMRYVVVDKPIGFPLFETVSYAALHPDVTDIFTPRMDGQLIFTP